MRRATPIVGAVLAALFTLGCDVFVDDPELGKEGERCNSSGRCRGLLVCNFGRCSVELTEGEACSAPNDSWAEDPCGDQLKCLEEVCTPSSPSELSQPDTNLRWYRCPSGAEWDGWGCARGHW